MTAGARTGRGVGPARHRRVALLAGVTVLAGSLALAGCTATAGGSGSAAVSSGVGQAPGRSVPAATTSAPPTPHTPTLPTPAPPTTTLGRPTTSVVTVIRTKSGQTITVGPPRSTAEPAATTGDCPYLSADIVTFITGQHHGQTQLVAVAPHPMCVFYRSDGTWLGSVRVIQAASPLEAVAAVNQHAPIAQSQSASQPAGWSGGSMVTPGQMTQDSSGKSVYAVSKGSIAVVAEENENMSIKPRLLAVCAIYGLKLETGPAPPACSGAEG